ncbi:uroporphyrinogen-III synthase [Aliikangiella sp. IMCC44359]|uniref:uroporphyrinogen-III synthase n=1 Tax=Aliikangiella sp. IMCC44359 TaxID=3459125 RepID=UPI00403AA9FD
MSNKINQLIITRPVGQAASLLEKLKQETKNKLPITHLPLIQLSPIAFQAPEFTQLDGAIFISSNAVRYFYQKASLPPTQLIAVGDNTAKCLKEKTNSAILYPEQMNSEGLINLPQLQSIQQQNWLIVKGVGGRNLIQKTLIARGAKVTELDVYQRKLPDFQIQHQISEIQVHDPVWIITSYQALENLYRILGLSDKPLHQTKIILSSQRLDKQARQKGFIIIALSAGASESELLQCVKQLNSETLI